MGMGRLAYKVGAKNDQCSRAHQTIASCARGGHVVVGAHQAEKRSGVKRTGKTGTREYTRGHMECNSPHTDFSSSTSVSTSSERKVSMKRLISSLPSNPLTNGCCASRVKATRMRKTKHVKRHQPLGDILQKDPQKPTAHHFWRGCGETALTCMSSSIVARSLGSFTRQRLRKSENSDDLFRECSVNAGPLSHRTTGIHTTLQGSSKRFTEICPLLCLRYYACAI